MDMLEATRAVIEDYERRAAIIREQFAAWRADPNMRITVNGVDVTEQSLATLEAHAFEFDDLAKGLREKFLR